MKPYIYLMVWHINSVSLSEIFLLITWHQILFFHCILVRVGPYLCTITASAPAASSQITKLQPLTSPKQNSSWGPFQCRPERTLSVGPGNLNLRPQPKPQLVNYKKPPSDPRVISDHEFISLESWRSPKAKLESVGSNVLSVGLQTTGEADQFNIPLKYKTPEPFHAAESFQWPYWGGFHYTDSDVEEQKMRSGIQSPAEYRPN